MTNCEDCAGLPKTQKAGAVRVLCGLHWERRTRLDAAPPPAPAAAWDVIADERQMVEALIPHMRESAQDTAASLWRAGWRLVKCE